MPSKILEKLQKLARLARCPAATKGEKINAATMLIKIGRKNGVDLAGYGDLLAKVSAPESKSPVSPPTPYSEQFNPRPVLHVMPSGRYKGKTFDEIYQLDPDYLAWVRKAYRTKGKIRKDILTFLNSKQRSI
jgi:uncharacterized protein (DUF3820 family)